MATVYLLRLSVVRNTEILEVRIIIDDLLELKGMQEPELLGNFKEVFRVKFILQ